MRLLEGSQAAVLSNLLQELERITSSDESSAPQLAEIILKDASLTSNIIKIGNSIQFNASSIPVTTVSRAILNIGFKNIRSFCVSIKVLEAVLKDNPSPLLLSRLATTLHGAAQAKSLCASMSEWRQEEVFVASLLSNLAECLVLGFDEPDVKEYKALVTATSTAKEKNQAAEKVLGVSFTRLSKTLMKQWRIEGIINDVLAPLEEPQDTVRAVQLGDEISRAALIGFDSPEFKEVMNRVADFTEKEPRDVRKEILKVADDTAESLTQYGKGLLNDQIPTSKKAVVVKEEKLNGNGDGAELMPDQQFQLKILQELSGMVMGEFNINTVFKTVLAGLNKGVGLERACLSIFDKSHEKLRAKYVMGKGTETWPDVFVVRYLRSHSGFLYNLFESDAAAWIGSDDYRRISQYLTPEYKGITGTGQFFIAPLTAKGKRIGFLYADMGISNRPLSAEHFSGFSHFYQQIKLALSVLANR